NGFVLETVPLTPYLCGREKTSSVGIFGLNVVPFSDLADPPFQICPSGNASSRSVPGALNNSFLYFFAFSTSRAVSNVALCFSHAATGSSLSTRTILRIASHTRLTASSFGLSGKTFCAQSLFGIAIIDQVILSFIVYWRKFFNASACALFALAIRSASASLSSSGLDYMMDKAASTYIK